MVFYNFCSIQTSFKMEKLKKIKLSKLVSSEIDIKEKSKTSCIKIKKSLEIYGQIYPLIVCKLNEKTIIVKGENVFKAMKELKFKEAYVLPIKIKDIIEIFNFKKLIYDTQDNLEILKLSLIIKNIKGDLNIDELSRKTLIHTDELINYLDLLKLDDLIKTKQKENQSNLL